MYENLFAEKGFSLDRLKSLVEIAEAGSISKAVSADATRQSLYSRQVKELEEFFGTKLTRKKGKVLILSSAGEKLVQIAKEYFSSLDEFRTNCKNTPRRYCIGAGDSIHYWINMPLIAKVSIENPTCLFSLKNLRNHEVLQELYDMNIDFGILRTNLVDNDLLKSKRLTRVKFAIYVPKILLGKRKNIDYKYCLENLPCASLAFSSTFFTMLKRATKDNDIDFKMAIETQSFPFALELLKTKAYAAILPNIAEKSLPTSIVKIEAPFLKMLERDISLAWNPRTLLLRPRLKNLINFWAKNYSK